MSLFAKATFSAANYAAARPSYPASLFKTVLAHHNAQSSSGFLLDVGCGHGLIARAMSPHFGEIVGIDASPGMVKQAASMTQNPKISFRQAGAEDLSFLDDQSVDMVVSGQAAHWFDYTKVWPELSRIVKPGGTLAFWGYKDNVLVGHKSANEILDKFCYAKGEVEPGVVGMQSFWEQPGRNILRDLLQQVEPPEASWLDVDRLLYDVKLDCPDEPDVEEGWMQKKITLGQLEGYVRTFSAFQGWRDAHPNVRSRAEGGEGDIADLLMERLVASEQQWKDVRGAWRDVEVTTVWGTYILMARKR